MSGLKFKTLALAAALAAVLGSASAQGIYTCTDAKGRRLTADRPILDCIDREQTELSTSGTARRKIAPVPTAAERIAQEEKAKRLDEERIRAAEDRKRELALVLRYPNPGLHDKERAATLALVDGVTATAQQRTGELQAQRQKLDAEAEFFKSNPSAMPLKLKAQLADTDMQLAAQRRVIAEQAAEKVRINARFDQELARLKTLWSQAGSVPTAVAARVAASASSVPASGQRAMQTVR